MQHVKEHGKNRQDQKIEEEISRIPEKELRIMIVEMSQNLGGKNGGIDKVTGSMDQEYTRNV